MRTLLVTLAMVATFAIAAAGSSTSTQAEADCCPAGACCAEVSSCCN